MSAEVLRQASAKIRSEWVRGAPVVTTTVDYLARWNREQAFHIAVAEWLDMIARTHEPDETGEDWWANCPCDDLAHAVAVAHAYLGADS